MRYSLLVLCLLVGMPAQAVTVQKWRTHELTFTTSSTVSNPFDTYLLKLRLQRPDASTVEVEGFYDDTDGSAPHTWKVRLSPDQVGTWTWQTIAADAPAVWNEATSGTFEVQDVGDPGPITRSGRSFYWRGTNQPVYLYGNFLDPSAPANEGFPHEYMADSGLTDTNRLNMRNRQKNVWKANKMPVYYANGGDYNHPTTPWVTSPSTDRTRMNLTKWALYDRYLKDLKATGILAEMYFFADDSSFGSLPTADQQRLVRYAMARHSAYSHTMFVMALETNESGQLTTAAVQALGAFAETRNPWDRLLSTHQKQSYGSSSTIGCTAILSGESWMDFFTSQVGLTCNDASNAAYRRRVFECGKTIYDSFPGLPHMSEEFGYCTSSGGQNATCRELSWGAFLSGGSAGSGTDTESLSEFITASRVPFQRMDPDASILSNATCGTGTACGYARYEEGHHYLVYKTTSESSIKVTFSGTGMTACWWNPASASATLTGCAAATAGSNVAFTPPSSASAHWVLWISDGSNLNTVRLHPDPAADAAPTSDIPPDPPATPGNLRRDDVHP